jgi:hypothetical protein
MMDVNTTGYLILLAMKEIHTPMKIITIFFLCNVRNELTDRWEMMDVNTTGYLILLAMKEIHTPLKITWLFSFYAMCEMSLQTAGR